jgi:HAE1 family hydrophobic/amphiphilic exporter-1
MKTVRLRDIANIYDGFRDEQSSVIINGSPAVSISVQKQSGTNSVKTADNVIARLEKINQEVPIGIKVAVISDTTKIIRASLQQVTSSAVLGGLFAIIVLFVFLRSIKSTIIVGLSIPVSIVITLMFMHFFDLTLNMMTLAGLALGVGMLVDNSIVILENIFRYREKGTKLAASAILGSQEMLNAILASTLTTLSVFAPLVMFKNQLDMIGEMVSGLAFTVVIALVSSLMVAMFLVPVLSSKYLPIASRKQRPLRGLPRLIDAGLEWFFTGLDNIYKTVLRFVLRIRWLVVIFMVLVLLISLAFIPVAGFELMPSMGEDSVSVNVELPIGTKLDVTKEVMHQLELVVQKEIQGYENIIVSAGRRGFFGLGSSQSNRGSLTVTLPPYEQRIDDSNTVKQKLRSHFNDFPGAVFSFSGGGMGFGTNPIDIMVKSNDMTKGKETAQAIKKLMEEKVPEVTEPSVNLKEGRPQAEIFINRDKAYSLGLNIYEIGQEIRANIDGITASKFREGGSEYDILVILAEEDRDEIPDIDKIFVVNNMGDRIPLASIARIEKTTGPVDIRRENQTRTIHVNAGLVPGAHLDTVEMNIRELIATDIPADEDVVIEFSGDYEDLMEYGVKFIVILAISVFLVFGVMASQFESFLDPFIIFFTMPLLLIGVIFMNVFTGEMFSLFTAVGLVMLVGIVVNNGIVLVDYTNLLRKRGLSVNDACVEAGGNRLRPILMTTLTTILALIPMSFFKGEGSELVQPIGKTVIGGLAVNTVLTLILVPVIYSLVNNFAEKRKAKREAKRVARIEAQKQAQLQKETE